MEAAGLTPIPALKVRPPQIEECRARLECTLYQALAYGEELILLGRIVAVSVACEALRAHNPYEYLQMIAFLENGAYGAIERGRRLPMAGREAAERGRWTK